MALAHGDGTIEVACSLLERLEDIRFRLKLSALHGKKVWFLERVTSLI
ncbi:hypothetical protein BVRB_8g191870 [Beta vulgaris subsp. vulgaris]|nr:hypothetical protein BVRB_8g191870 [Beta vulgaris subsp. vulgaris]